MNNQDTQYNEMTAVWDRENVRPCCTEFPFKLVDYLHRIGRPNKLKAVARWNIAAINKYQREIRDAGFSLIHNPYREKNSSDEIIMEEIMKNMQDTTYSHIVLISGDGDFLEFLQSLGSEIILISNPMITSTCYQGTGISLLPFFNLCNCDTAKKMRAAWLLKDYDNLLVHLFKNIYKSGVTRLCIMGTKIRESLGEIFLELDWKRSRFRQLKDIAVELGIIIE